MLCIRRLVIAACLWATLAPRPVLAQCPEGSSEQCLLGVCACISDELAEQSKRAGGLLLEQWLLESRDQSVAGAKPVPAEIRAKLKAFVDKAVLDAARYKIGDDTELNLASLNLQYGDLVGNRVAAVTLIDVIVFRDAQAAADATIWAHELYHVRQFRDWGVHDFAMRYARDFHEVEDPAYAFAERLNMKRGASGTDGGR